MEDIIREIAELLDREERVFLHMETMEILSFPDPDRMETWEEDYLIDDVLDQVEADPDNYVEFRPPDTRESYRIMDDFTETVLDMRIKRNLLQALNSKKPFRHFRQTLEQDGVADDWYDYKLNRLTERVLEVLERRTSGSQEA